MSHPKISGLYAITPDVINTANLVLVTHQALVGGVRLIQYRNKVANRALRLKQAVSLLHLCRKFHVPLIINDDLELAIEIGADGVHLGAEDIAIIEARQRLGPGRIIGASCYNLLKYAIEAEQNSANYVAFGAFFSSITKPSALPVSIGLLYQAKQYLHVPIVAIGGVTSDNALELIHQGVDAVAISNSLFNAIDVQAEAKKITCLFKQAKYSICHSNELSNDLT